MCVRARARVRVRVRACVCVRVRVRAHTHTYTHTFPSLRWREMRCRMYVRLLRNNEAINELKLVAMHRL